MTNTTRNRAEPGAGISLLTFGVRGGWLRRCTAVALIATSCLIGLAAPASAIDLALPGNASETARIEANPESHALAIGPVSEGAPATLEVEGRVSRTAWRVAAQGVTTLQLLQPLRDQLLAAGFEILFDCKDFTCGGFDFRYRLKVFPEPAMHVDLFDYRYLAAMRLSGGEGDLVAGDYVTLLVSRSANAGYLQIVQITPSNGTAPKSSSTGKPATSGAALPDANLPLIAQLEAAGHAVLADLAFETGSSNLGPGPFASLETLAGYLLADPARRVALVGHTDAVGALDGNIALSKRRAASVLERLVEAHGVPRNQLAAEGMGYLAPIASNRNAEGREQNRRVEAVLLNTD